MSGDRQIAELEHALADATLALEQAREQLVLLPGLYEGHEDAARRLRDAAASYESLAAAYDELSEGHEELQRHSRELYRRLDLREAEIDALARAHRVVIESRSWRLTGPLRRLGQLRRRPSGNGPAAVAEPARDPVAEPTPAPTPPESPADELTRPATLRMRWEYPSAGSIVGEYLYVSGWAVGEGELAGASILCSGVSHPLRLGRPRWDVAALFPARPEAADAGFDLVLPRTAFPPGSHELELVVRDSAGNESRESRPVRLDVAAAYRLWQADEPRPGAGGGGELTVCACGDARGWAQTLDSLAEQSPAPTVAIAPEMERPVDMLGTLEADWVVLIRPGARLTAGALGALAEAIRNRADADVIYADHDLLGPDGARGQPFLKPGWSPELLLAMDYVGPVVAIRRELLLGALSGLDRIPAPDELLLRLPDDAGRRIHRLPRVLASMPPAMETATTSPAAIAAVARRRGLSVDVTPAPNGTRHLRWGLGTHPLVSVIIASANARGLLGPCLESLRERTSYDRVELVLVDTSREGIDGVAEMVGPMPHRILRWERPFNYSLVNNFAADHASGEFLVLLNDDTEVIAPEWVERLLEYAQQPGVGVVGAKLVRPDGTLQHGGARLVSRFLAAKHLFEGLPANDPGPRHLLTVPRNCSGVTFACAMVSKALYDELGGLDAEMKVTFNDIDFCLRALAAGRRVVWTPYAELLHYEQASRGAISFPGDTQAFRARWGALAAEPDPYYHPRLSDVVDHELLLP
jgi:GT2 family glycosyltransferase